MKTCPNCGQEVWENTARCTKCGHWLSAGMQAPVASAQGQETGGSSAGPTVSPTQARSAHAAPPSRQQDDLTRALKWGFGLGCGWTLAAWCAIAAVMIGGVIFLLFFVGPCAVVATKELNDQMQKDLRRSLNEAAKSFPQPNLLPPVPPKKPIPQPQPPAKTGRLNVPPMPPPQPTQIQPAPQADTPRWQPR